MIGRDRYYNIIPRQLAIMRDTNPITMRNNFSIMKIQVVKKMWNKKKMSRTKNNSIRFEENNYLYFYKSLTFVKEIFKLSLKYFIKIKKNYPHNKFFTYLVN
jgi:hypothetical protein